MRKLKLQMQLSVDGFVADVNGHLDWLIWNWDEELKNYASGISASVDTMFVGRVTYEGMAAYWPGAASNTENEDRDFAQKISALKKIVFSNTLEELKWQNSYLAEGNICSSVSYEKQQEGKDIIIYGGAEIVSSFIKEDLIDEYYLFINPVALGSGKPIFNAIQHKLSLKPVFLKSFNCGITVLCYHSLHQKQI